MLRHLYQSEGSQEAGHPVPVSSWCGRGNSVPFRGLSAQASKASRDALCPVPLQLLGGGQVPKSKSKDTLQMIFLK